MHSDAPTQRPQHIQALAGNAIGKDIAIGDLHGSLDALEYVIQAENLGENDRLFIVGDLIDRGPESQGVIEKVMALNEKNKKPGSGQPTIYVVRGNHEEIFLEFAKHRLLAEDYRKSDVDRIGDPQACLRYIYNITKDYPSIDSSTKNILADFMSHLPAYFVTQQAKNQLLELLHSAISALINGGQWALDLPIDTIKSDYDFLTQLPFILHVRPVIEQDQVVRQPFNIVHADLSLSDEELLRRIAENRVTLSEAIIYHSTWARGTPGYPALSSARNQHSILTCVGHTIEGGARLNSMHLNLDTGTYGKDSRLIAVADLTNSDVRVHSLQSLPMEEAIWASHFLRRAKKLMHSRTPQQERISEAENTQERGFRRSQSNLADFNLIASLSQEESKIASSILKIAEAANSKNTVSATEAFSRFGMHLLELYPGKTVIEILQSSDFTRITSFLKDKLPPVIDMTNAELLRSAIAEFDTSKDSALAAAMYSSISALDVFEKIIPEQKTPELKNDSNDALTLQKQIVLTTLTLQAVSNEDTYVKILPATTKVESPTPSSSLQDIARVEEKIAEFKGKTGVTESQLNKQKNTPAHALQELAHQTKEFEVKANHFFRKAKKTKSPKIQLDLLRDSLVLSTAAKELRQEKTKFDHSNKDPARFLQLSSQWEKSLDNIEKSDLPKRLQSWTGVVVKNVLLSLTVLGLIAIGIKYAKTGELGFFRTRKTMEGVTKNKSNLQKINQTFKK